MPHNARHRIQTAIAASCVALLTILASCSHPPAAKNAANWDAGAKPTPLLDSASFRWWAPPDTQKLRGIIVIIPGLNGDARAATNDKDWQQLARKKQFAIVACRFYKQGPFQYQSDPDGKISALISKAVNTLSAANNHPYLKNPPLAFYGTSAGSNMAERYAFYKPSQVIAVACIKGTWGPGIYTPEKSEIPWLVCVGKNDKESWVQTALNFYNIGHAKNARWTLALHPVEGHSAGKSKPLALAFLSAAIDLRLPSSDNDGKLRALPDGSAWTGDPTTLEISPATSFNGKKENTIWLPNEATAREWRIYLTRATDKIPPPSAPQNLNTEHSLLIPENNSSPAATSTHPESPDPIVTPAPAMTQPEIPPQQTEQAEPQTENPPVEELPMEEVPEPENTPENAPSTPEPSPDAPTPSDPPAEGEQQDTQTPSPQPPAEGNNDQQ